MTNKDEMRDEMKEKIKDSEDMKNVETKEIKVGFDPLSSDNIDTHFHTKPRDHELKINPRHFKDVLSGAKKSELRRGNTDYQVGDYLTLREFIANPPSPHSPIGYTGRSIICQITHVLLANGVYPELRSKPDFVVLSINVITATAR